MHAGRASAHARGRGAQEYIDGGTLKQKVLQQVRALHLPYNNSDWREGSHKPGASLHGDPALP